MANLIIPNNLDMNYNPDQNIFELINNDIINNLNNNNYINDRFNIMMNGNLNRENFYDDVEVHIRNQLLNDIHIIDNQMLRNIIINYFNDNINRINNANLGDVFNDDNNAEDNDIIDALFDLDIPYDDDNVNNEVVNNQTENQGDLIIPDHVERIEVPTCRICMENRCVICFVPCGHVCACGSCSQRMEECPICRSRITRRQGLFFA